MSDKIGKIERFAIGETIEHVQPSYRFGEKRKFVSDNLNGEWKMRVVEAEYITASDAFKEAIWVRKFIYRLGVVPTIEEPIKMYCDNTGAISIANESGITKGVRHYHAKVHYLRELGVSCYTDAGYLTDADGLKSQTGYVFVLNGDAIDCKSTKQSIFATLSAEAEYIAALDAFKEAVWVRKFIAGLGITKGARHYCAKVYYLREVIEFDDVKLEKVHTDDNLADPFTKALDFPKYSEHIKNILMLPASNLMKIYVFH
ncbi:hypothetical protein Tco_0486668 [Tanacetum coccineum]